MRPLIKKDTLADQILKYLEVHGTATVKEICEDNPTFDRAGVIRELKKMNGYYVKALYTKEYRTGKFWSLV